MRYEVVSYPGLGQTTTQLATGAAQSAAAIAIPIAEYLGAIGGPVGAVIGGAVAAVAEIANLIFQPNVQKIQASNDANQIEPALQKNLANWLAIPTNLRYQTIQQAALNVFDTGWAQYTQAVTPLLGKAPSSISDRQQGSCAYHTTSPVGWVGNTYYPNTPNVPTGKYCWNWFVGYRDPIANDPNVQPDPSGNIPVTVGGSGVASDISNVVSNPAILIGGAALLVIGLLMSL